MPTIAYPPSQITSEVDFNKQGKFSGYLRLPHSVHRSAYGFVPIPVVSIRNGKGPVVLLVAGNHGDEYEGQVGLANLARRIEPKQVQGQLIILTMANYPAARAGLRTSPIDDGNLNRSFPGNPDGTPTQMIAHYIENVLMPRADYLLDLHSGGSSLCYQPTLLMAVDTAADPQQLDLLRSLGFPKAILFPGGNRGSYSSSAASRQNTVAITAEIAGGGTIDPQALSTLERGLDGYLDHIGVVQAGQPAMVDNCFRLLEITGSDNYLFSDIDGLFEPLGAVGQQVRKGALIGRIHDPARPLDSPREMHAGTSGEIVCMRVPARVEHGDCLYEIANFLDPAAN